MKKIIVFCITILVFFSCQTVNTTTHLKKDGTPDKRYKENKPYKAPAYKPYKVKKYKWKK